VEREGGIPRILEAKVSRGVIGKECCVPFPTTGRKRKEGDNKVRGAPSGLPNGKKILHTLGSSQGRESPGGKGPFDSESSQQLAGERGV